MPAGRPDGQTDGRSILYSFFAQLKTRNWFEINRQNNGWINQPTNKLNFDFSFQRTGLVEFSKMQSKLGLSWNQVSQSLDKFAQIARNRDGKIGIEEFANYLGLPNSPALKEVFDMYDRSHTGEIDFRYLIKNRFLVACARIFKSFWIPRSSVCQAERVHAKSHKVI